MIVLFKVHHFTRQKIASWLDARNFVKPKFFIAFSIVTFIAALVILFHVLFLLPEISKLKVFEYLSRKASGSIPLLVFGQSCCVTKIQIHSKGQGAKKKKRDGCSSVTNSFKEIEQRNDGTQREKRITSLIEESENIFSKA